MAGPNEGAQRDSPGNSRKKGLPWTLLAQFAPGALFALGLLLVRDVPRFHWLYDAKFYPPELWIIAFCGAAATLAGAADWVYHRSAHIALGRAEHHSELLALTCGGLPLFTLMAVATILDEPSVLLVPILMVVLFTTVMICYDEFVFHRRRCGPYENFLHRILVMGNGAAWLAWMNWCFVRGGPHG